MKLYRLHYLVLKLTYEFLSEATFRRPKSAILDFQNRAVFTKLNQIQNAFGHCNWKCFCQLRMAVESTAHDQTVTRPCRLGQSLSPLLILLRVCVQAVYSLVILVVNTAMVTSLLVLRTRLDSKTESDRLNAMTNICNRFVATVGIHCSLCSFKVRCRANLWSSVVRRVLRHDKMPIHSVGRFIHHSGKWIRLG